jgi:hypothetical protein
MTAHPDNYIPANPFVTPNHIVPEWYFLAVYAILRSCATKLEGIVAFVAAILFFLIISLLSISTPNFTVLGQTGKVKFYIVACIVSSYVLLTYIGGCPVEAPYINLGEISALNYFYFSGALYIFPSIFDRIITRIIIIILSKNLIISSENNLFIIPAMSFSILGFSVLISERISSHILGVNFLTFSLSLRETILFLIVINYVSFLILCFISIGLITFKNNVKLIEKLHLARIVIFILLFGSLTVRIILARIYNLGIDFPSVWYLLLWSFTFLVAFIRLFIAILEYRNVRGEDIFLNNIFGFLAYYISCIFIFTVMPLCSKYSSKIPYFLLTMLGASFLYSFDFFFYIVFPSMLFCLTLFSNMSTINQIFSKVVINKVNVAAFENYNRWINRYRLSVIFLIKGNYGFDEVLEMAKAVDKFDWVPKVSIFEKSGLTLALIFHFLIIGSQGNFFVYQNLDKELIEIRKQTESLKSNMAELTKLIEDAKHEIKESTLQAEQTKKEVKDLLDDIDRHTMSFLTLMVFLWVFSIYAVNIYFNLGDSGFGFGNG